MFFLAVWISVLFNDNVSIQQCPGVLPYLISTGLWFPVNHNNTGAHTFSEK